MGEHKGLPDTATGMTEAFKALWQGFRLLLWIIAGLLAVIVVMLAFLIGRAF